MAKPIFILKYSNQFPQEKIRMFTETISNSPISKDYHILFIQNELPQTNFYLLNGDKIDEQEWKEISEIVYQKKKTYQNK
jgi:hypothetical protein